MSRTLRRDERGFTLTEMLVVIALLGFVVMAAYGSLELTFGANEIQRRDAYLASNLVEPLQRMDVVLSQNIRVLAAGSGDYTLDCLTDADANNALEEHLYVLGTDGSFVEEVYNHNGTSRTTLKRRTTWQRPDDDPPSRNSNQLLSPMVPIFHYRAVNESGTANPTTPGSANMVEIRLYVRYDGVDYHDVRKVWFRNR